MPVKTDSEVFTSLRHIEKRMQYNQQRKDQVV